MSSSSASSMFVQTAPNPKMSSVPVCAVAVQIVRGAGRRDPRRSVGRCICRICKGQAYLSRGDCGGRPQKIGIKYRGVCAL